MERKTLEESSDGEKQPPQVLKLVPPRKSGDWITSFQTFTKDIPSPEIFRKWTAISILAGALQRRVWIETAQSVLFPNLYVLLVSPPGVGKSQAISRAGDMWAAVNSLHVAPDSVTRASLIDCLEAATTRITSPDKTSLTTFHALTVPASEFGVLVPSHDLEFLNTLNHIFDCPGKYRENRRSRSKQVDIERPMLNILGGTQPAYLATLLPEEAWGMGFTSRLIMVYSAQSVPIELFNIRPIDEPLKKSLIADLEHMTTLFGKLEFNPQARFMLETWAAKGLPPVPTHSRLQNYNARRLLHILKLCMIASVSRNSNLVIEPEDVNRARDWLLEAEDLMPDIFRDMAGKSDVQVIDDLHGYMWRMYARDKKPLHVSRIVQFLQGKVPSEKVMRILDLCERSHTIERLAGTQDMYIPAVRDGIAGVE